VVGRKLEVTEHCQIEADTLATMAENLVVAFVDSSAGVLRTD
jgi:hypothetical protein